MSKYHPKYDDEFKREVVIAMIDEGWTQQQTADHYGVAVNTLRRWKEQFDRGESAYDDTTANASQVVVNQEVAQNRATINELKGELAACKQRFAASQRQVEAREEEIERLRNMLKVRESQLTEQADQMVDLEAELNSFRKRSDFYINLLVMAGEAHNFMTGGKLDER